MPAKKSHEIRIRDALRGLSQGKSLNVEGKRLLSGIKDPPSYITHVLLSGVLQFAWTTEDKSAWEVGVEFRGFRFSLSDWKRSYWSISSETNEAETVKAARELRKKLVFAGRLLNQAFQSDFQETVASNEFYLLNSYGHVRRAYDYFRDEVETRTQGLNEIKKIVPPMVPDPIRDETVTSDGLTRGGAKITYLSEFSEHLTKMVRAEQAISHNAGAMVGCFFSYTELIFDVSFAFRDPRPMNYFDYRSLTWAERFKTVLPVASDRKINLIYQRLDQIKRRFRDVIFHGYGGSPALLVSLGPYGLVPVSYQDAMDSVHYSWVLAGENDVQEILQAFSEFDEWLDSDNFHWCVRRYAESMFEIPFDSERVAQVRGWMSSREAFQKALDKESYQRDYADNQY